eukprot:m.209073 g.209073  ORF g.209073 m.209073 type:complete len:244 (+) comp16936_c0_seq5:421-1152(+)
MHSTHLLLLVVVCLVHGTVSVHGSASMWEDEQGSLQVDVENATAPLILNGMNLVQMISELQKFKAAATTTISDLERYRSTQHALHCQFSLIPQTIATKGAADWEHFVIDGVDYLAVASFHNDDTFEVESEIFKWNSTVMEFVPFQSIPTKGARDWEHFVMDDVHYLAVANVRNDSTRKVQSEIFTWDTTLMQFVPVQIFSTTGARDCVHFVVNDVHYLAVASNSDDNSYQLDSLVYIWNGCRF